MPIICLGIFSVNAQQKVNPGPSLTLNFEYTSKQIPDSVVLTAYPTGSPWDGIVSYFAFKSNRNSFTFQLPKVYMPLRFFLMYNDPTTGQGVEIGSYYAENKDDINIRIFETTNKDSTVFMGVGAAKYNLIEKVLKDEHVYMKSLKYPKFNTITTTDLKKYLEEQTASLQQEIAKKKMVIDGFSPEIAEEMKKLIGYQFAIYFNHWQSLLGSIYDQYKDNHDKQNLIRDEFNLHFKQFLEDSDEISILSWAHYQRLVAMFRKKALLNSKNGRVDINEYYNSLKQYSRSPKIKERILTQFLMGRATGIEDIKIHVRDSLVRDIGMYLLSPIGKALTLRLTKLLPGTELYDAKFIDVNGRSFDTSALRDKVFIIDLWTNGCTGCAAFHKMFHKELWPKLKDNKNFEFISVAVTNMKRKWESAIEMGTCTSPDYLNVFLGEGGNSMQWTNHPFIKNYEINSVPFILLVDKRGKIVRQISSSIDKHELSNLIYKSLINTTSK